VGASYSGLRLPEQNATSASGYSNRQGKGIKAVMIAWSRLLIDDHCSSWTIVQLLEWFNVSDIQWSRLSQSWRFNLGETAVFLSEQILTVQAPDDLCACILDVNSALGERCRWLEDEPLRYCPTCIQSGMHYRYQQDKRFRHCILHRRKLKTGCPRCGIALDTKGREVHGFVCKSCGASPLRREIPGAIETPRRQSEARVLDELEKWEAAANAATYGYQKAGTGEGSPFIDAQGRSTDASLYWYALVRIPSKRIEAALSQRPHSFKLFPTTHLSPLPHHLHDPEQPDPIDPYRKLLRCIARRLRRTHLKGHAACRIHATRSVGISDRRIHRVVKLQPHLCCLAQAYAVWLMQRRIELREIEDHLFQGFYLSHTAPMLCPSLREAALSYLSSFEEWVQTLAQLQSSVRRSNKNAVHCDGISNLPHWSLFQRGASRSCPVHLRIDGLRNLGRCDKGRVLRDERDMIVALGLRRHLLLNKLRARRKQARVGEKIQPDVSSRTRRVLRREVEVPIK